jgi:hypothetical protein
VAQSACAKRVAILRGSKTIVKRMFLYMIH